MPLYTSSADNAFRNARENRYSRWHRADAPLDEADGKLAFQRLRSTFLTPLITPQFKVSREDKIFAIGSCFARGIERALLSRKMNVVSAAPEFATLATIGKEVTGLGFTNKYNTYSIFNELSWALDPVAKFPEGSIIELGNGMAYDPHTNPTLPPAGRPEILQRRSLLSEVNARIADCRVVIVTLGLVEHWRDTSADTVINTTPPWEAVSRYPGRYEFQVSTFSENMANLEKIHALLARFGHPQHQIVVTVSPVPLMATFTPQDVIVANTYSKSLLRTVAQEWSTLHENVHYFPSYEIVMNSSREEAWLEDFRHVQGALVNHIMGLFLQSYLEK